MVMQETLRFQSSVSNNSPVILKKDCNIGKYRIKAGTEMIVHIQALNHSAQQWQRPDEFLPERFDKDDPLYLTPNGKKRHAFSFVPFNGGRRVCFGKTLAEANLKMIATYLTQYFNIEHVDEKFREKNVYPVSHLGMTGKKPVFVELKQYNGF